MSTKKKVAFHTLGCKLNFTETSTIARSFVENGFELTDFSKKADIRLGGKKSLEALSQSGAFDSLAPTRSIAIACTKDMLKDGNNTNGNNN